MTPIFNRASHCLSSSASRREPNFLAGWRFLITSHFFRSTSITRGETLAGSFLTCLLNTSMYLVRIIFRQSFIPSVPWILVGILGELVLKTSGGMASIPHPSSSPRFSRLYAVLAASSMSCPVMAANLYSLLLR